MIPTGTNSSLMFGQNDPLAGLSKKQIFIDCVWISKLPTTSKIFLLSIARYLDADARSSSMSYAQIAESCSLHESTAKRIAKAIVGIWLDIKIGEGFGTPKGPQNLYHGKCPPEEVERLRETRKRDGRPTTPEGSHYATSMGSQRTTPSALGVAEGDPKGSHRATHTLDITPDDSEDIFINDPDAATFVDGEIISPQIRKPRRSRFPNGAALGEEGLDYARSKGLSDTEAHRQFERFADHHKAKGSLMADWSAAWRTWITNAVSWKSVGTSKARGGSWVASADQFGGIA